MQCTEEKKRQRKEAALQAEEQRILQEQIQRSQQEAGYYANRSTAYPLETQLATAKGDLDAAVIQDGNARATNGGGVNLRQYLENVRSLEDKIRPLEAAVPGFMQGVYAEEKRLQNARIEKEQENAKKTLLDKQYFASETASLNEKKNEQEAEIARQKEDANAAGAIVSMKNAQKAAPDAAPKATNLNSMPGIPNGALKKKPLDGNLNSVV